MTATYPGAVKQFVTFQDQPGPDALTIDYAADTNEIHDEIKALETTLGPTPLKGTRYSSFNSAFNDLYNFKVSLVHFHPHSDITDDRTRDDHTQYARVDGARTFTSPVPGASATSPSHLMRLSQVSGAGYSTTASFTSSLNTALNQKVVGKASTVGPLYGSSASTNWGVTGGVRSTVTDSAGQVFIDLGPAFSQCVQSLIIMRQPFGGFGAYSYRVDQILILACSLRGAVVQFIDQAGVYRNRGLVIVWMAIGI